MSEAGVCPISNHHQHPIRFICLEKKCVSDRLICIYCIRQRHQKHSIANIERYMNPLAKLGVHSHLQDAQRYKQDMDQTYRNIAEVLI